MRTKAEIGRIGQAVAACEEALRAAEERREQADADVAAEETILRALRRMLADVP